ncbi:hypothetical protein PYW08_016858 [Mythimna loreyi]|nr:hypothetical protein PYW08_016858 [Mythimna loreyi]
MNFLQNITIRRTRTKSDSMLNESDVGTMHATLNETVTSVPEMSDDDDDEIKKLKDQITKLTLDLQSAHLEIEELTLEANKMNCTKKLLTVQLN